MLSIQPRVASGGGGMSSDEIVLEKCKYFKENLVYISDRAEADKAMFTTNAQGLL